MDALEELIERWNQDEGKPYKGQLIDWAAYEADPDGISCMCAQGQVLHVVGGWDAETLSNTEQSKADEATAKLLNISRAHAILLRNMNDKVDGAPSIVLTDPGKVLGDQWSKLLDFWWHMDRMTAKDWAAARAAAWDAAWAAARDAAWDAAWEIQGGELYRNAGRPFFFLPLFGFKTPDDIPARPENYGRVEA